MEQRTINGITVTSEQNLFLDAVILGKNVKGRAYAGAGKSTLLRGVEKYHKNKKGLYICFNKSLEIEAKELFNSGTVDVYTSHGLALSFLDAEEKRNILSCINKNLPLAKWVELSNFPKSSFSELSDFDIYNCIKSITEIFYQTASLDISEIHLTASFWEVLDKLVKHGKMASSIKPKFITTILNCSRVVAASVLDGKSSTPKTHDSYLKRFQLEAPKLKYDYIMFDECQDANPVLLSIVESQQCQKIYVGDDFQAIYPFRGCINAMAMIPYQSFPLSQSFRFGPKLAELASRILNYIDKSVKIIGSGFDTEIYQASSYEGGEPILFISNTNIENYELLLSGYKEGIPTKLIGEGKSSTVQNTLRGLIELKEIGSTKLPSLKKYSSIDDLIENSRSGEQRKLAELTMNNTSDAEDLISAFDWTAKLPAGEAVFTLTTAHMCKGLEADNVFINDDFLSIIQALSSGKEIAEVDLYLFYVAITRAKKKLIISDSIFLALKSNNDFAIIKNTPLDCHLDNLNLPDKESTPEPIDENPINEEVSDNSKNVEENEVDVTPIVEDEAEQDQFDYEPMQNKDESDLGLEIPVTGMNSDNVDHEQITIEVGRRKVDGEPQYWTPTDTNRFMNPNLSIVGTMGTGKTQTTKSMLLQLARQRSKNTGGLPFGILIFDYKSDFKDSLFVKETGAIVFENNHIPVNPFALIDKKDRFAPIRSTKNVITSMTKCFNLGQVQQGNLKSCVTMAYERSGVVKGDISTFDNPAPTFADITEIFYNQEKVPNDKLSLALDLLAEFEVFEKNKNKCKNIFETMKDQIVVISLSGLDENVQNLIVALLLDSFYLSMHLNGKPKQNAHGHRAISNLVMVDEADSFMQQEFDALKKILKEGREYGVGMVLSTQGLGHFKTDNNNYLEYMNAAIVHRLESVKGTVLSPVLNVSKKAELDKYIEVTRGLEKHHSIWVDGSNRLTYQESTAFWKEVKNK